MGEPSAATGRRTPGRKTIDTALERVFDENAETYDRVNTLISLGLDSRWRRWVATHAVSRPGLRLLDAFSGTGLVGIEAAALGAKVTLADASPEMLRVARRRVEKAHVDAAIAEADLTASELPFARASFDAITIVFGVRYLVQPSEVLARLSELLTQGGTLVVLEFVVPKPSLISRLASVYFFRIIPRIAPLLGGRSHLHDTLAETTRALGTVENLRVICESAGLVVDETQMMGFGLVAGLVCRTRA